MNEIYYWYCPACNVDKQYVDSLHSAHISLNEHEKEVHKKKPIGMFGFKVLTLNDSCDKV